MTITPDFVVVFLLASALVSAFMLAGFAMSSLLLHRVMLNSTRATLASPRKPE